MKKIVIVAVAILALAGLCLAVNAACAGNKPVSNSAQGMVTGLSATPANVYGQMWVYGNGAAVNAGAARAAQAGGAGCANVGGTNEPYWDFSGCLSGYGVYADLISPTAWATGCPNNTDRIVILLQDTTGKFAVISKVGSAGTWDLDQVATRAAAAPTWTVTRTSAAGANPVIFSVTTSVMPSVNGGYAAGDGAAPTVITGYEVYYQNAAAAPSTVFPGSWTLCTNGALPATAATTANIQSANPGASANQYLLLVPVFESGFRGSFGQILASPFGPNATPVFNNVTADATSASWTSGIETRVATYQVYWSVTETGTYKAVGTSIPARGDNQTYTTNYRVLTTAPTYYVKVRANKTDGTYEFSAPVLVVKNPKTTIDGSRPIIKK